MPNSRKPDKFAVDISLFKAEPPSNDALVKSLFAGRDHELERGFKTLKNALDIRGERSQKSDKRPWVIHGESRSGKSHLARRILAEFKNLKKRPKLLIPARDQVEAQLVMAKLFREVVGIFRERVLDQRLPESVAGLPNVRLVDELIARTELFLDEAQSASVTREQSGEATLEIGGELTGLLGKLVGKYQSKDGTKEARQIILKPPTAETLAELCGVMLETLISLNLVDHLLILVDDVDLLDPTAPTVQQVRLQRKLLINALCTLHEQPGIDVLITVRSWYYNSEKVLTQLIDLSESVLPSSVLLEIHDKHLEAFAHKAGVQGFLLRKDLQQFADEMEKELNGLPGVFLHHLFIAFDRFKDDKDLAERDYEWFIDVFRRKLRFLRDRLEPTFAALQAAFQAGRLTIILGEGAQNDIAGTSLDGLFLWQSYHNERCYFTSPLMRRLFVEPRAAEGGVTP